MPHGQPGDAAAGAALATARQMLENDAASRTLGMEILEVRPGYARVSMAVRDDMLNGFQIMHGGLTFTLADSAFAFACNSFNRLTVAQSCDIDFTNAARAGDVLTAECKQSFHRGRSGVYDVTVTNQSGETIALFRGKSRTLGDPVVRDLPQLDPTETDL